MKTSGHPTFALRIHDDLIAAKTKLARALASNDGEHPPRLLEASSATHDDQVRGESVSTVADRPRAVIGSSEMTAS
jgi:hypothetical protein